MTREDYDKKYPPRTRSQLTNKQVVTGEWFHSIDGKWRKRRPDCTTDHTMTMYGFCSNCDYSLRPAEETATGR